MRNSLPKLKEKLLEALKAVLPIVGIVVKTATKNRIMRAIMDRAGMNTKARSIVFSLPVTGTAGMRLLELAGDETDGG